jgi:Uma2 family endonuclease
MFDDSNISTTSANPLAVLTPEKEPRRYTLAQYLHREERSQELHEYFDGLIIKKTMAREPHNFIGMNIGAVLKNAIKTKDKKYLVSGLQQLVYLPILNFSLYPDVIVIAKNPNIGMVMKFC